MSRSPHSFEEQVALAKAESAYYGGVPDRQGMWSDPGPDPAMTHTSTGDVSMEQFHTVLQDPNFREFVKESYDSEGGYAIRFNPVTGKKEMMVAGTRHNTQWALNAYDAGLYGADKAIKAGINDFLDDTGLGHFWPGLHVKGVKVFEKLDPWRQEKQKYYEEIAKAQGVDVIYGHSRGGAMVSDMKVPGAQKVGLDAAMLIAHDTGMLNINEGGGWNPLGLFDEAIGLTGENNVTWDASFWSPHKVWAT